MTVAELIEKLKQFPPDTKVAVCEGPNDAYLMDLCEVYIHHQRPDGLPNGRRFEGYAVFLGSD